MQSLIKRLDRWEIDVCLRINALSRQEPVRRLFSGISRLGDGAFWIAPALALVLMRGVSVLPALAIVGMTAVAGVAIYKLLKERLVRERPFIFNGAIRCGAAPLDRYSFPSGHTLHAVSFTSLYLHLEPGFALLLIPFAVLVAASRVVLGLHYPSDVLAGAVLGAALAALGIGQLP